jgi:hypothetical protein
MCESKPGLRRNPDQIIGRERFLQIPGVSIFQFLYIMQFQRPQSIPKRLLSFVRIFY